jgi:hypothetical protein
MKINTPHTQVTGWTVLILKPPSTVRRRAFRVTTTIFLVLVEILGQESRFSKQESIIVEGVWPYLEQKGDGNANLVAETITA